MVEGDAVGDTEAPSLACGRKGQMKAGRVATIADGAVVSARELFALVAADRARVLAHDGMSIATLRLFELLPRHPVVTVASAMKLVETTKTTAARAIELLVGAGLLEETPGRKRDRAFEYRGCLDRPRVETEVDGAGRGSRA